MNYNNINTPFMPDGKGSISLLLLQKKQMEISEIYDKLIKHNINDEHTKLWEDRLIDINNKIKQSKDR